MKDEIEIRNGASKEAFWQNHFQVWEESGLSISEYCELEGLSRSSFGYWRHKLRKFGRDQSLVEVKPAGKMANDLIHILLADATELGVPPGTDVGYVSRLVAALKGHDDAD